MKQIWYMANNLYNIIFAPFRVCLEIVTRLIACQPVYNLIVVWQFWRYVSFHAGSALPIQNRVVICFSLAHFHEVWSFIQDWLGVSKVLHSDECQHCIQHGLYFRDKQFRKVRHLVWHVVTWCLQLLNDRIVFLGATFDMTFVLTHIK